MNQAKIFITLIFLLAFAVCISAQSNSIAEDLDFNDLLNLGPKKNKNLELGFLHLMN